MLVCTLEHFRCTLAEVRQDYWLNRAWRALAGDPAIRGVVARYGIGNILIHGPVGRDRDEYKQMVADRILVDTQHTIESLDLSIEFAESRVTVGEGCMLSLLAQTVVQQGHWHDLPRYAADLSPVIVPVAQAVDIVAAA